MVEELIWDRKVIADIGMDSKVGMAGADDRV